MAVIVPYFDGKSLTLLKTINDFFCAAPVLQMFWKIIPYPIATRKNDAAVVPCLIWRKS
jgi:hypothetical protein